MSKYIIKVLGVRKVHRPAFQGDNWYGFEAIVLGSDNQKYYFPLFGVWKQRDRIEGGYYYESDTHNREWKYLREVKKFAECLADELYGESK